MKEYPPLDYLSLVLQHCPKAGFTYLKLWNARDANSEVVIPVEKIRSLLQITKTRLKNDLLALANEGVLSVNEYPNSIIVELTDWDFDCKGNTLC